MTPVVSAPVEHEARQVGPYPDTIVQVGSSTTPVCGVRDYAGVLERAFRSGGTDVSTFWCDVDPSAGVPASVRQARRWLSRVRREIEKTQPRVIILHYSVFAYGPRGVPVLAPLVARELAATGVPVLGLLHEFAYPFGRRGWRGTVQALSHRAALPTVVRHCDALAVTSERRASWLATRRWLPRRPVVFIPVFSNLPPVEPEVMPEKDSPSIGVFGFGGPAVDVELVASAVAILRARGRRVRLVLIGAPGPNGAAARRWWQALEDRDSLSALRFTGVQAPRELARELAGVDVLVFADRSGPDSRRTTLAAGLALGRAVVAVDGPERWGRAVSERAIIVASPGSQAFAAELERLLDDRSLRESQGARAAEFYGRFMAPEIAVARLLEVMSVWERPTHSSALAGKAA